MPSDAFTVFELNLKRSRYFINIHEDSTREIEQQAQAQPANAQQGQAPQAQQTAAQQEGNPQGRRRRGSPPLRYRELPRAALVFSVGAIDAYLSDLSAERIVFKLEHGESIDNLRKDLASTAKDIPTLALELSLLEDNQLRKQRLKDTIAEYFHEKTSNHGPAGVSETARRLDFDVKRVWDHLRGKGYLTPEKYLDDWTKKRHRIVHRGEKVPVRRKDATDFIDYAELLVNKIDELATAQAPAQP